MLLNLSKIFLLFFSWIGFFFPKPQKLKFGILHNQHKTLFWIRVIDVAAHISNLNEHTHLCILIFVQKKISDNINLVSYMSNFRIRRMIFHFSQQKKMMFPTLTFIIDSFIIFMINLSHLTHDKSVIKVRKESTFFPTFRST